MEEIIKFYRDENEYTKVDLDNALETLYQNEINNKPQDSRLTRENTGTEYSIIYKDCRFAVKYVYEQMRINKTGIGLKDETDDKAVEHSNSNSIRKIISKYYPFLSGIEYPDKEKKKIQDEYKSFLKEHYKERYAKDPSIFSDPFYAYNNKNKFKKYGIYFWKILDNDRNLQHYRNTLEKIFNEQTFKGERVSPQQQVSNYYNNFLKLKEFFDTKYGGYLNWMKQNYKDDHFTNYYWVCQKNYEDEKKRGGLFSRATTGSCKKMKNLKPNDIIVSYDSAIRKIRAVLTVKDIPNVDEKNDSIEVPVEYNEIKVPIDKDTFSKKFANNKQLLDMNYPFQYKSGEFGCKLGYLWLFTSQAFNELGLNNIKYENSEESVMQIDNKIKQPLNQILYGPPGTGKTYNTVVKAMGIIGSKNVNMKDAEGNFRKNYSTEEYKKLKKEFDYYKKQGRIEFITFHQSYSYEEFVEGIKPDLQLNDLKYVKHKGIFKRICESASTNLYKPKKNVEKKTGFV